ncbi:DoxX family protein [Rhodococcus sp. AD45-ID]|uniref:DoxX family protein n=1 Tax=unclassified Rhodococcus (in: high G+C Gram-positive bacteria) TaxID=192944 RepID=UPI0005D38021|nr:MULTISPECIES: DoxX family protein [unclassified Rhodococcus (in: high G+C Gram-positive bacteria)]KJF22028.1 DoxX [Rhodococcus sp. AD45]NRI69826.1 DoxX family protein [Rhodococcus sp. MS16]PSR39718.1 DoxX family protein [Rhodococcus sp. AD45-ID]
MTDERKDPSELSEPGVATGKVSSPYDSPTEQFPPVNARNSLPRTDDDLDFGSAQANSVTEQIPAYRPGLLDKPTEVLTRDTAYEMPADPVAVAVADPIPVAEDPRPSRGTLDLGLLALRLAVGGTALVHGLQKLTGLWNGPGLGGFETMLAEAGFEQAKLLAILGAVGEVAGGALLILGLLTPIAAASVLAVMINAWALRQLAEPGLEYFAPNGTEYEMLLGICAGVIILTGPGRIALDGRRGWAKRPFIGSLVVLILGIGAGVCTWIFLNGANPLI